jgi:hypothetical protein
MEGTAQHTAKTAMREKYKQTSPTQAEATTYPVQAEFN